MTKRQIFSAENPGGQVPRRVDQGDRVEPGAPFRRYKCKADTNPATETQYVLAGSEAEAREFYLEETGLASASARMTVNGIVFVPAPVTVTALPD